MKTIATDLDQTLLRSDKTISPYTADVFHCCRQQGIKVVFATARSERSAQRFICAVSPDIIISNGGALARCGDEILYRRTLSPTAANSLIRQCMQTDGIGYITVETGSDYLVNHPIDPDHPGWLDYLHATPTDFSKDIACNVYKVTVQLEDERAAQSIAAQFPSINVLAYSGENWFRFAHENANKWEALQAVAARLGLSTQNIVAFGDDYNDIEMLKNCGVGVAVANGLGEAKAAADHVCGSNDDDGVARWIAKHLLHDQAQSPDHGA